MIQQSLIDRQLIDTHCHLDFPVFDRDRDVILEQCREKSIAVIVVPGVCRKDWQRLIVLCHEHEMLFPALGLHPCFLDEHQAHDLDELAHICDSGAITAIGEIGLDFFSMEKTVKDIHKDRQGHYFSEQLQIARQFQLPVLIHARKSHEEVIRCLKAALPLKGIIHAFSGSYEQAREYLKLGFKLGFGGAFTYPKATKLRLLLSKLPLDAWVLETDAPDMSPIKHYGERNSPTYLTEIFREFVKLYDAESDSVNIIEQLQKNTRDVFPFL